MMILCLASECSSGERWREEESDPRKQARLPKPISALQATKQTQQTDQKLLERYALDTAHRVWILHRSFFWECQISSSNDGICCRFKVHLTQRLAADVQCKWARGEYKWLRLAIVNEHWVNILMFLWLLLSPQTAAPLWNPWTDLRRHEDPFAGWRPWDRGQLSYPRMVLENNWSLHTRWKSNAPAVRDRFFRSTTGGLWKSEPSIRHHNYVTSEGEVTFCSHMVCTISMIVQDISS